MDRIERLKEFLSANPNDNFVQHALALEYIKAGDDTTARQLFETVLQRDENYVGSYYHLGKLMERNGDSEGAIAVYQKGMAKAKEAGEQQAYNELQAAYEDLVD
jgi:Tfp pilus assembly protein PilF